MWHSCCCQKCVGSSYNNNNFGSSSYNSPGQINKCQRQKVTKPSQTKAKQMKPKAMAAAAAARFGYSRPKKAIIKCKDSFICWPVRVCVVCVCVLQYFFPTCLFCLKCCQGSCICILLYKHKHNRSNAHTHTYICRHTHTPIDTHIYISRHPQIINPSAVKCWCRSCSCCQEIAATNGKSEAVLNWFYLLITKAALPQALCKCNFN